MIGLKKFLSPTSNGTKVESGFLWYKLEWQSSKHVEKNMKESEIFWQSIMTAATDAAEAVFVMTTQGIIVSANKAVAKPCMTSPPRKNNATSTNTVVKDVMMVRDRV